MKLFFFNDKLNDANSNGSTTIASRELNNAAQKLNVFANADKASHIIHMDSFNLNASFGTKPLIPFLISEYSQPASFLIKDLEKHSIALAISEQTRQSFIKGGADPEKIKTVHLGVNPMQWPDWNQRKKNTTFTFLTHNTSNERSGFNDLIPAFLEWSKGKDVKLIIKDQQNDKFHSIVKQIDADQKIIYIGQNLNHLQLVELYNNCHCHLYINAVTSFGMTPLQTSCAGLPQIVSKASALTEFTSNEFVNYVDCREQEVDNILLAEYNAFGLVNNLPPLQNYSNKLFTSRPKYSSVIEQLDFAYNNYSKIVEKNNKYINYIKENLTWENSIKKIVKVLS